MVNQVKNQKSKNQNINRLKRTLLIFSWFFLFFFLFFNIFTSQLISPLYFQLINNHRPAVIEFLKKIKTTSSFPFFFDMNKKIYNARLEDEVYQEEKIKRAKISQLELVLKKNPKARDVLYQLYLLHAELGEKHQAEKYFKIAREVDPELKR